MENSEAVQKTKQFERLYTTILVLLVAILLLVSILYTSHLWLVKVAIAVILTGMGTFFGHRYLRERKVTTSDAKTDRRSVLFILV